MVSTNLKNISQIGSPQVGVNIKIHSLRLLDKLGAPGRHPDRSIRPRCVPLFSSKFVDLLEARQSQGFFFFAWKGACFCDDGAGQRDFLDVVWMMEFTWSKDLHKTNKLISMTHLKHIYKTCYNTCAHIWYVYTVCIIYNYIHTFYKQKLFNTPYTHNH